MMLYYGGCASYNVGEGERIRNPKEPSDWDAHHGAITEIQRRIGMVDSAYGSGIATYDDYMMSYFIHDPAVAETLVRHAMGKIPDCQGRILPSHAAHGHVFFHRAIQFDGRVPSDRDGLIEILRESEIELYFPSEGSLYDYVPEDEDVEPFEERLQVAAWRAAFRFKK